MPAAPWFYPEDLCRALEPLGLRPTSSTPPSLVRDALNDLYRHELRRLRDRHRAGEVAKPDFVDHVIALRKKYWPLSLQLPAWERICEGPQAQGPGPRTRDDGPRTRDCS
jgi:hypothetical protein